MTNITLDLKTIGAALALVTSVGGAGNWVFTKLNQIESNVKHIQDFEKRTRALECYLGVVRCDGIFASINYGGSSYNYADEAVAYSDEYDSYDAPTGSVAAAPTEEYMELEPEAVEVAPPPAVAASDPETNRSFTLKDAADLRNTYQSILDNIPEHDANESDQ